MRGSVVRLICDEKDLSKTLSDCSKYNAEVLDIVGDDYRWGFGKYVLLVRLEKLESTDIKNDNVED